ncbi:MAG: TerB family tellurite resistance protein [Oceanisphaera sp.]|uniref:tellurite resistance TerB family protein n=1 Tax=Oceanisphaera sp. TaxID=1929979 RepID=UPI003F943CAE
MLEQLKQWLTIDDSAASTHNAANKDMAITALLSQVMLADGEINPVEQQQLERLVTKLTQQTPAVIQQLLAQSRAQRDDVVSLYEFTSQLKNLPIAEREDILYSLWALAFSDGTLDPEEEGVIRQVAELLYVPHSRFIWLKQQAQEKADL